MFWLRQRDSDGIVAAIINDTDNQNGDQSAMSSSSVVSNRQLRRLRNHTERMVFVIVQTSSDTEVVGDLLILVFWLRQRDSDWIADAIIHETGNQNDDNSALRSSSVNRPGFTGE